MDDDIHYNEVSEEETDYETDESESADFTTFTYDNTVFYARPFWEDVHTKRQPQKLSNISELAKVISYDHSIYDAGDYASHVVTSIIDRVKRINSNATVEDVRTFLYNRYGLTFI